MQIVTSNIVFLLAPELFFSTSNILGFLADLVGFKMFVLVAQIFLTFFLVKNE